MLQGFTPWLVCIGAFAVPIATFALGIYIGKRGYSIQITRNAPGGQEEEDVYGLG